jgi:hypothetical protein
MKAAITLSLLLFSVRVNAQPYSLKWSAENKLPPAEEIENVIAHTGKDIFVGTGKYLIKFNAETLTQTEPVKYPEPNNLPEMKGKNQTPIKTYYLNGKLWLLTTMGKGGKATGIYLSTINTESLQNNNDAKEICIINGSGAIGKGYYLPDDSAGILLKFYPEYTAGAFPPQFLFINKNGETDWEKTITQEELDKDIKIAEMKVDSKHNLVCITSEKIKKADKEDPASTVYSILVYDYKNKKLQKHKFDNEKYFYTDMKIVFNKEGNLNIIGLFSEENKQAKKDISAGTFCIGYDASFEKVLNKEYSYFKTEIIEKITKRNKIKNMNILEIVNDNEGNWIIFTEQQKSAASTFMDQSGDFKQLTTAFYYGSILILKYSNEGKLVSSSLFWKNQDEPGSWSKFLSALCFQNKGISYLIFNDDPANFKISSDTEPETMNRSYKSIGVVGMVKNDGSFSRAGKIFDAKEEDLALAPGFSKKVSADKCVLFARKAMGAKYKLGVITFQ